MIDIVISLIILENIHVHMLTKKQYNMLGSYPIKIQYIDFVVSFKHGHLTGKTWPADDCLHVVYFTYHMTGKA